MVNYRHPRRPGRHRSTVGDVTPDLYVQAYDWHVGGTWVTVTTGAPARHAAPVRPVSLVKSTV